MTFDILRRVKSVTDVRKCSLGDVDNNDASSLGKGDQGFDLRSLPPVSTCIALLLILVYNVAGFCNLETEALVAVSWEKVVTEKQIWRIFFAHFFHTERINLMINVTTLMALGRYLERKIRPIPMLLLILLMGAVSNLFYILISKLFCQTDEDNTLGFSHVVFALKMVQVLSKDAEKRRGPTLLLGVVPVYLGNLAPWEPLLEGVLSDVLVKGKSFSTNFAGIVAGLCFPLLDYCFHECMVVPSKITLTFTPSSKNTESGGASQENSSEELDRIMKLLNDDKSPAPVFHELSNDECVTLFHRRVPMISKSLQNQCVSKSESYLFLNEFRN